MARRWVHNEVANIMEEIEFVNFRCRYCGAVKEMLASVKAVGCLGTEELPHPWAPTENVGDEGSETPGVVFGDPVYHR